jgi:peptide deformylase
MVVTNRQELSKPCKPCGNVAEGINIGNRLLEILSESNDGVGLAANQVGIDSSVCVVYVIKPIILVNPRISGKFGKSFFQEGCLSFPGDYVITERWTSILVTSDNHAGELVFSFEKDPLECVCVQHEIDHLNGVTMFDRQIDMEIFNGKH